MEVCYYTPEGENLKVYEFGYSSLHAPKSIAPYVRHVYLLHIVTRGTCHFCEFDAEAGSAFLISKNKLHSFSVDVGYEHYWFGFDGENAEQELEKWNIPKDRHIRFSVRHFAHIRKLLTEGKRIAEENPEMAQSLLYSLFPLLVPGDVRQEKQEIAERAKRFMDIRFPHRVTMEDVAKHCFVSEKYLCHKFKERYGMPPKQYLLTVRMQHAKRLLAGADLKIKEVALSVGYHSQLAFSGAFKAYTGQSPGAYREKSTESR